MLSRHFLLFVFLNFCFSDGVKIKTQSYSRYTSHCCYCYCYDHWNTDYIQVKLIKKRHLITVKIQVTCLYTVFTNLRESI